MRLVRLSFFLLLSAAGLTGKPQVVTTHTVLNDLVKVIAEDRVDARCLLPINLDPHSYEPKPADVRALAHADLVLLNGLGLEPWSEKVITQSGFRGSLVRVAEALPESLLARNGRADGEAPSANRYDPHAWHDPRCVGEYSRVIAKALEQLLPGDADFFRKNLSAYTRKLEEADRYARERFNAVPSERRRIVTSHDSLRYFAKSYGLTIVPVAGTRPDQEPSARQLAELVTLVRTQEVKAVFFDATSSSKLVDVVARETGVAVVKQLYTDSLGPAGSAGETYLGMFRSNVDTVVEALK